MLGIANGIAATLGDLAASQVKRTMGIKDFSGLLGAHGGVLDRLDSLSVGMATCYTIILALTNA